MDINRPYARRFPADHEYLKGRLPALTCANCRVSSRNIGVPDRDVINVQSEISCCHPYLFEKDGVLKSITRYVQLRLRESIHAGCQLRPMTDGFHSLEEGVEFRMAEMDTRRSQRHR